MRRHVSNKNMFRVNLGHRTAIPNLSPGLVQEPRKLAKTEWYAASLGPMTELVKRTAPKVRTSTPVAVSPALRSMCMPIFHSRSYVRKNVCGPPLRAAARTHRSRRKAH